MPVRSELVKRAFGLVAAVCLGGAWVGAQMPQANSTPQRSWNPFAKKGPQLPATGTPQPDPNDPTSLANKKKPDASFYASWAELEERGGRHAKALELYQRALSEDRRNLAAMLGSARINDAQGDHEAALRFYRQAIKAHPKEAAVYNDLALSHAKAGQTEQAIRAFERAIEMDGQRKLYRNNLANTLIDENQLDQALFHLQQVYGEAGGHYTLGELLASKKRDAEAIECFARAQQVDPGMVAAHDYQRTLANRMRASQPPQPSAPQVSEIADAAQPPFDAAEPAVGDPNAAVETHVDESVAAGPTMIDFGASGQTAVDAAETAPVEPALPESNVALDPVEVNPTLEPVFADPQDATAMEAAPLSPVVKAAPGPEWASTPSTGASDSRFARGGSMGPHDGRPALPPRPSAVQLYRQHASHTDQAPTPESLFPSYDPSVDMAPPVDPVEPLVQSHAHPHGERMAPQPHVTRRQHSNHQPTPRRSARQFKNPFSGWFGTKK